jgi:hypothetical protein
MLARAVAVVAATVAAAAGIAAGSGPPIAFHATDAARLRLSWSARPERIERCRALSEEELALRPEHMRQRLECAGSFATYALAVAVDGRPVAEAVIMGGGVRNDRPIHDLRELDVPPGVHRVHIALSRREADASDDDDDGAQDGADDDDDDGPGTSADRAERERTERTRRQRAALPAAVVLDTSLVIEAGRVIVVTYDAAERRFRVAPAR